MNPIYEKTTIAPVNIAVIKYWGKRDTALILPTNSSLSLTLSQDLRTKTTIAASPSFPSTRLWLNGKEDQELSSNKRFQSCVTHLRSLRSSLESTLLSTGAKDVVFLSTYNLHICSENNFPTAAGLASSASGYACLVYTLSKLYELDNVLTQTDLSKIARLGSGSACRSIFGGFVAWRMGILPSGYDSFAEQIAPSAHWPLYVIILIVSSQKKVVSSTAGMQNTVQTSTLYPHRLPIVEDRMQKMGIAIKNRDFETFAELTIKDSNQFHAVCLDTFPPIFYLNDVSRGIISLLTEYNRAKGALSAAYTFDAGPNACVYVEKKENVIEICNLVGRYFPANTTGEYVKDEQRLLGDVKIGEGKLTPGFNEQIIPIFPDSSVKQILLTRVGDGPRVVEGEGLLNREGLPKKTH